MKTTFPGIRCVRKGGYFMPHIHETQITPLRVRSRVLVPDKTPDNKSVVDWVEPVRKRRGEALLKNLAVSSALVLCAVTLRAGTLPTLNDATDVIMTAATDHSLLDDQLGKLSFVSALFPEAVLVFGESGTETLAMPVSGGVIVHAWSEAEPYMSWRTNSRQVTAASAGEVIGVYHGNGDERLMQVMGNDGLACLYGNMSAVSVQTGDAVMSGDVLGELMTGSDFVFEVRRDGMSIDPAVFLAK